MDVQVGELGGKVGELGGKAPLLEKRECHIEHKKYYHYCCILQQLLLRIR